MFLEVFGVRKSQRTDETQTACWTDQERDLHSICEMHH